MTDKQKINHEPPLTKRNPINLIIRLLVPIVSLIFFSEPIAEILLIVNGHPNASAAINLARDPDFPPKPLATYTPLPTYTDLPTLMPEPTYTALATYTPYPTYTPLPTNTPTNTPTHTPTPTPIPPGAVLARIQAEAKAELVVAEHNVAEHDFHIGVNSGLCSYGGDFTAQGAIEAGLNLTDLEGKSVVYDAETQTYSLLLPSPQLTTCDISYIRLVNVDFTVCPVDFDILRLLAEVHVMDTFIDRALEGGIIDEAKEQSSLIMEDLVHTFTGKQVISEFETESGKPNMDESCEPSVSDSWIFDESKRVWEKREG